MAAPIKLNFKVYQGSTFREILRWESATKVYKSITAISKSAPVVITASNHGAPLGWRARVVGAGGMKEINTADYYLVTDTTSDTVVFNTVNSLGYTTYTTGGVLEYNQPIELAGYTARMQVREKLTSETTLLDLTTENGGIVINTSLCTIEILATATQTAALEFNSAVYSLELVFGSEVIPFATGTIQLIKEITR